MFIFQEILFNDYINLKICTWTNNLYDYKYFDYYFGSKFNQPLANEFVNLINLLQLTLDEDFNQPLSNLLDNLINLQ